MKELTNMGIYIVVREEYQTLDFIHSYCRKWVEIKLRFVIYSKPGDSTDQCGAHLD